MGKSRLMVTTVIFMTAVAGAAAAAATLDASVWFRETVSRDATGLDACFRGDVGKSKERWDYTYKYDLPVTLLVTTSDIRKLNERTGKLRRLPGSQRAFRFNLKDWGRYRGPAFYRVEASPNGIDPCALVALRDSSPAGVGEYFAITGKLRVRVASRGRYLGESRWAWRIETYGGGITWLGTDEVTNICRGAKIRSTNGRRYCLGPYGDFMSIRRLTR